MFVFYNILQLVFLPIFLPFITLFVLCSPKYRNHIPARLGVGLASKFSSKAISTKRFSAKTIWLHALSVGEVTSAIPLIAGLRKKYPDSRIIVSVTTGTGKRVAESLLKSTVDCILDGPLDLLPVVYRFIKYIQPDLFILVETDFWPNTLLLLQRKSIPTILVNGRMSQKSIQGYQRMRFFFNPMFHSFSYLCMQTKHDRDKMEHMGLPTEKLHTLGNLKFDTEAGNGNQPFAVPANLLPENRIFFICGSTHAGEERVLIDCYSKIKKIYPELVLIIAPRDSNRSAEIQSLAAEYSQTVALRSENRNFHADIFILDTIGELMHFYALSDIAFVGGSLVQKNGHNPIEPAIMGLPVIFGPNMQDFSEIAEALISSGGATEVANEKELCKLLSTLLSSAELRTKQGKAAEQCVKSQRGVIDKHLELIHQLL